MTKTIITLFVVILIAGCSTTPSSPKPHKTKYAFQCLQVASPDSIIQELGFSYDTNAVIQNYTQPKENDLFGKQHITPPVSKLPKPVLTQSQIEDLIKRSDIELIEFPVVYAGIGESVTNDQTKTEAMAVDANVVEGNVVCRKEPYKFGKSVSITVNQVKDNVVNYKVDMMNRKFKAFDEYKTKDGLVIKMPFFESRGLNTEISQPPYVWTAMGGLIDQRNDGQKTHEIIIIRIIPPIHNI
ncbi:hypothetical protein [Pontiella sulfatireligans]|uniref:Lipoprotein n=1 Tax=Pontiella sulfatireligans TaxID=2750658 RepID=A0A6C2UMD5_9BACT|nr:hypothetical protein [Pontiella sulfatireligans]VGO20587.1 hypothetical protein SCARR_02652 [Pontiella sulfatireligans]